LFDDNTFEDLAFNDPAYTVSDGSYCSSSLDVVKQCDLSKPHHGGHMLLESHFSFEFGVRRRGAILVHDYIDLPLIKNEVLVADISIFNNEFSVFVGPLLHSASEQLQVLLAKMLGEERLCEDLYNAVDFFLSFFVFGRGKIL